MPAKNKVRGNNFELALVNYLNKKGLKAVRAWGSNGRALGYTEDVDVKATYTNEAGELELLLIQCKKRKTLPAYMKLPATSDAKSVVFAEDRGDKYIMMPLDYFVKTYIKVADNYDTELPKCS
jgi:Holliday junction resolvase